MRKRRQGATPDAAAFQLWPGDQQAAKAGIAVPPIWFTNGLARAVASTHAIRCGLRVWVSSIGRPGEATRFFSQPADASATPGLVTISRFARINKSHPVRAGAETVVFDDPGERFAADRVMATGRQG